MGWAPGVGGSEGRIISERVPAVCCKSEVVKGEEAQRSDPVKSWIRREKSSSQLVMLATRRLSRRGSHG